MLERIANTFVAGVELLEAEGRLAREQAARLARRGVACGSLAALFIAGVLASLVGMTWLLARTVGTPEAVTIVGLAVAAGSGATLLGQLRRLGGGGADEPWSNRSSNPDPGDTDER